MNLNELTQAYRIELGATACRSSAALVTMNVREIPGVEAVTAGREGTLIVVTSGHRDVRDELVRAVVESGLEPQSLSVIDLERQIDLTPMTIEEAQRAGLIAPPKQPARAVVETV